MARVLSDTAKGYLITLGGVAVITPDTLLIRLADVEPFTLAVTRGVLGGLVVLALSALLQRGVGALFHGINRWILAAALIEGVGLVLFVAALSHTTAANVLILFATTPMMAAVMGQLFLGERVGRATWAAIAACFVGVVVVGSGSLGSVHLFGDVLALIDAVTVALFFVVVRHHREVSMVPAMGLGLLLAALMAAPFAAFPAIGGAQLGWVLLAGLVVVPVSLMLLTLGPRYIGAPEVAMLTLLETVIGPFWVWLVLAETPGPRSLAGGAIIVVTLFLHGLWQLRAGRKQTA